MFVIEACIIWWCIISISIYTIDKPWVQWLSIWWIYEPLKEDNSIHKHSHYREQATTTRLFSITVTIPIGCRTLQNQFLGVFWIVATSDWFRSHFSKSMIRHWPASSKLSMIVITYSFLVLVFWSSEHPDKNMDLFTTWDYLFLLFIPLNVTMLMRHKLSDCDRTELWQATHHHTDQLQRRRENSPSSSLVRGGWKKDSPDLI